MDIDHVNPYDTGTATPFPEKAKRLVVEYYNQHANTEPFDLTKPAFIRLDDVYVVWFAKTLGNWKALISTTVEDGKYYEVTYNGNKYETYVDVYEKKDNVRIPD